jgi:hypothetical protein
MKYLTNGVPYELVMVDKPIRIDGHGHNSHGHGKDNHIRWVTTGPYYRMGLCNHWTPYSAKITHLNATPNDVNINGHRNKDTNGHKDANSTNANKPEKIQLVYPCVLSPVLTGMVVLSGHVSPYDALHGELTEQYRPSKVHWLSASITYRDQTGSYIDTDLLLELHGEVTWFMCGNRIGVDIIRYYMKLHKNVTLSEPAEYTITIMDDAVNLHTATEQDLICIELDHFRIVKAI